MKGIFGAIQRWAAAATLMVVAAMAPQAALAHGEKAQEPFLRMRTAQWYDVEVTKTKVAVNEELAVRGKFRFSPDEHWPRAAAKPTTAFLNVSAAGPVFVREGSFVNGVNMANSTTFELGRDYEFEVKLKASEPGRWHIHSMMNIQGAGPLVGPGSFVEVTGNHDDFLNEIKTLTGETVNLSTYGTKNNIMWHLVWGALAVAWLGYWLAKPLFFSRFRKVEAGDAASLTTRTDRVAAGIALVSALGLTFVGYSMAEANHPVTLPLQSAHETVAPLPIPAGRPEVKLIKASYRVPGRAMNMTLDVTNKSDKPIRLGEFASATVRFLNPEVGMMDEAAKKYPKNLMADKGLTVSDNKPIQPGETRRIEVQAQDAAWEVERLSSLIYDPDSRFGGLLFFYDSDGKRQLADVGGVLVPTFVGTGT
ncbi:bacterial ammonia monooxygenase, subunit AmoB [Methylibium sp.]|uniref:bacterial ammonia monooxygenase, subunit AmoB n=1 Tax=Methylibium sp. TaxID=2067992 RepID=UPI003D09E82D